MPKMEYQVITPEGVEYLKSVTAPDRVFYGDEIEYDYAHDEMPDFGIHAPDVLVEVLSTEEVSKVMRYAHEHCIPVTPRGAGTGLSGGAVPIYGGILLCTEKMNKILEWDLDTMTVVIEPGVLVMELANAAQEKGVFYPPEPGEKTASVGGNVMTNAGGMKAVGYGVTRNYVVSMECVMPNGDVMQFGSNVAKNTSGYDIKDLVIGSEGTLGIITELTLKLIPAPKETISLIIPYENLEDCIATVPKFFMNHFQPQALEFMEKEIVLASERYLGKSVFPKQVEGVDIGAYLLVTFDGDNMEQLEELTEQAAEVVLDAGAVDVLVADTPAKKKDAWAARSSFLEAIEAETKLLDECDVVVPVNQIAKYLTYVKGASEKYDFEVKSFGHAGDGNLHIYTCANDMDEETFKKQVSEFMADIYRKAAELGGLISGEHGIGFGKKGYLAEFAGPVNMRLMRGIKETFDPKMILNPGKICYDPKEEA